MNTEKMKKAAANMDTGVKVIGGIFGAAAWVLMVMAVLVAVLGEKMFDMGAISLDLEYITLHLQEGTQVDFTLVRTGTVVGLIAAGVVCFLVERGAKLLRKILAAMKEGRPFDTDAPASLRKIAWMTLIGGALMQIAAFADHILMTRAIPVAEIFSAPVISEVEYSFTMDLGFVWVTIAALFLSYVFEYGQKLQVESDETL